MGALPRPDLPPGPHRELNDALHDLHHRAGRPSLRALAADVGCSHTTVSHAFSSSRLPAWGTLELLVESMAGDVGAFHDLWLAASAPGDPAPAQPPPRIAGRKAELAAVRRHLEAGSGLLLVTGEAGIGKTRLVTTVADSSDTFVAVGHCLALPADLPLLPVADVLRTMLRHDDGRWFGEALTGCPPFVAAALAPLLPELAAEGARGATDSFARHRMFTATAALLDALAAVRPFAVVLEDLHWADGSTLDLCEHLAARGLALPVIGTWRSGDRPAEARHEEWPARLRRQPGVTVLELPPLTREETSEQLLLTTGTPPEQPVVDRVHALAQGLPLYTEHLAGAVDGLLPQRLGDLLDLRLGQLQGAPWQVARVLGVAERSLSAPLLRSVSSLGHDEQQQALRSLAARRLVRTGTTDRVTLAHPLLAEGIRRRLLPGEATAVHARLAEALGELPDAEPGEVAHHWQEAGRPDQELAWRTATARQARRRLASREVLESWTRVLHLCTVTDQRPGAEPWEILCEAIDAAEAVGDVEAAGGLVEQALALDLEDVARVQVLRRAGDVVCWTGDHATGLALLDEAGRLVDRLPATPELVDVLLTRIGNLSMVGHYPEVRADLQRAFALLAERDDALRRRRVLNWAAWHAMAEGEHDRAWALATEARDLRLVDPDPLSDIALAVNATDILLFAGAPATRVEQAAATELGLAAEWDLHDHHGTQGLRINVAEAHLRSGGVRRAADALGIDPREAPSRATAPMHVTLAAIQARRGDVAGAMARCEAAEGLVTSRGANWADSVPLHAEVALWAGRTDDAAALLEQALVLALPTDNGRNSAPALTLLARAMADLLDEHGAPAAERRRVGRGLRERVGTALIDPFGPGALGVQVPAWTLQWGAELARLEQADDAASWSACAVRWDGLTRPHDAAYCRWRAAQAALRDGRSTIAVRLLRRAADDAREHVPLGRVIAATAAGCQ
jgi:tetratricopeptide (TPR) repeat protein